MPDDTSPRHPNDTPATRVWTVPTTVLTADGEEVPSFDSTRFAVDEVATVLQRVGGHVQIAADRTKIPAQGRYPERYETTALVIRWFQFLPVRPASKVSVAGESKAEDTAGAATE
jgi:hypothetical protein